MKIEKDMFDRVLIRLAYQIHPEIGRFFREHSTLLQFGEFCLVGAFGVLVNFIVFTITLPLGVYLAWFLGILVATISNFILNKKLVFKE